MVVKTQLQQKTTPVLTLAGGFALFPAPLLGYGIQRENMARNTTKKSKKQLAQADQQVTLNGREALKLPALTLLVPPPSMPAIAVPPQPVTSPKVKVTFVLPICHAKRVCLSGEFNGWSPDATPMKRHDDGHWETTFVLAPGRYEYKFVCDGEWMPDLLAHAHVWNLHGTLNSVIEVRA